MRAEDLLPDHINSAELNGVIVRKGTVGAFLANAAMLADPSVPTASREQAEKHIVEALPALAALKLFEVFEIRAPALRSLVERNLPPRAEV
jgi:hypothetical protein